MENPVKMDDLGGITIFGNIHIYTIVDGFNRSEKYSNWIISPGIRGENKNILKQPPGKNPVNNGINYQPQLVFSPEYFRQRLHLKNWSKVSRDYPTMDTTICPDHISLFRSFERFPKDPMGLGIFSYIIPSKNEINVGNYASFHGYLWG